MAMAACGGAAPTVSGQGFNTAYLCQIHHFFVCCSMEPRLRMEVINDMGGLKEKFREAF
jgi:hypothetical protein